MTSNKKFSPPTVNSNSDSSEKKTSKHVSTSSRDRPVSARTRNLQELQQLSLLTSGNLKTERERKLAKALETLITRVNDKAGEIKQLNARYNELEHKYDQIMVKHTKAKKVIDKETRLRTSAISDQQRIKSAMAKIQLAVSARLRLLGIDFENITSIGEALDASLRAINSLIAQLQEKEAYISKMEKQVAKMKKTVESQKKKIARLEAENADQKAKLAAQSKQLKEQAELIDDLRNRNNALNDENTNLKSELANLKKEYNEFKDKTQRELDELRKTVLEEKSQNVENTNRIQELEARIRELEDELRNKKSNITDLTARVKELEAAVAKKDKLLAAKDQEIATKDAEIARLLAIVNRPKSEKSVQTEISGAIEQQLSDYPRMLKEIVALKQLLDKKNQRIRDLEEENRQLMLDMEWLLKRAAAFRRDTSNHLGQVWQMRSAPHSYTIATGSTDMTVRLWKVLPGADKSKKERAARVFRRADIDGKVESLSWSRDGSLLACGTGFRDTAEGYIVVWSMAKGDNQFGVLHAIRSRPTTRFGRATALTFSPDMQFIFAGDTVGSIWCFNLRTETIVGLLQSHTDVIHDLTLDPKGTCLYSVSLDQSLAVCELGVECGGNKNNDMSAEDVLKLGKKSSKQKRKNSAKQKRKVSKSPRGGTTPRDSQKNSNSKSSFSNMSLKDLVKMAEEDEYRTYNGVTLKKDGQYPYWRVACSADGQYICCATRKLQIYKNVALEQIEPASNISDMDMEHVRSLHIRKNLLLSTRVGCPRAKLFYLESGKQFKKMTCKAPINQADFLYDDAHIALLQQVLVANEAPKPPKMTLYCYDKDAAQVAAKNKSKDNSEKKSDD